MGTITESFSNLTEYLQAEQKPAAKRHSEAGLILSKVLRPLLPSSIRLGLGTITDVKDRHAGPLDIVASLDGFPPFSEGPAATYLADGVVFCAQVRDWAVADLSQFGDLSGQVKKLDRKVKNSIPCLAVSFAALPLQELSQFLNSPAGQSVDGILCVGHHLVLRNSQGWYGDPARIPFVTERPGPEALKAFTFFLLHLAQSAAGLPFGLADYQHL